MNDRRPNNIFRFRRLKWGAPKKLDGLKAIGIEKGAPKLPAGGTGGTIGLLLVGVVAGFAIVLSVLGWF